MTLTKQDLTAITGIVQTETRKIVNGQSAMKSELLTKINGLNKKIDGVEERLTKRIDKIGMQEAELEDDAPTRDEFDNLETRVKKVEVKLASA